MNMSTQHDDVLKKASDLVPKFRERAARTETLRQIPPESIQDLVKNGLNRIGIPECFGGTRQDVDAAYAVSSELGRGCGSTAWCYAVWTAHSSWLAHFPEEFQDEYFARGPDTFISSGLNPRNGKAERVKGGFRISGQWPLSSGCDAASWVIVASSFGTTSEGVRWMMLPRSDYDIVDTWFSFGLRGSGSKDVLVRDAFVPEFRTIAPDQVGSINRRAWERHERPSYAVSPRLLTAWALAAPIIGMAQGVVDEFTSLIQNGTGLAPHSVPMQHRLAMASAEVDTARRLHRICVLEILARGGSFEPFSSLDCARYRRDSCFVVNLCLKAANRLYESSGAKAIMDSEAIQRLYRDVLTASHHGSLSWDTAAEQFSRLRLGIKT